MANNFTKWLNNLPTIARFFLVAIVVVFISLLAPNNTRFKYEFQKGQTWKYNDLFSTFDFPILKTEEEINQQIQSVESNSSPYYKKDAKVAESQKKLFLSIFDQQIDEAKRDNQFSNVLSSTNKYRKFGLQILKSLYTDGIIQLENNHKTHGFVINIVEGNTTSKQTIENIQSLKEAKDKIGDILPNSKLVEPEFLLPILNTVVKPNIYFSPSLTKKFRENQLENIIPTQGLVKNGSLIISKDGIVTEEIYQKLVSYKKQYEQSISSKSSFLGVYSGYLLIIMVIISIYILFLKTQEEEIFYSLKHLIFMFIWFAVFSYLTYVVNKAGLSPYIIPFCISPFIVKYFYNSRVALLTHISIILIISLIGSLGYEFVFIQILAGIVASLTFEGKRDWSTFFQAMMFIFLTYVVMYFGISFIKEGKISEINWTPYSYLIIGSFLLMLAYPLIPLIEKLFGFTTSIALVELSDISRPLLKELSMKAPGTLQHSLQVANLAEAAANKINANALLIKVGALYHDIGKMANAEYFIENQPPRNFHDDLTNFESAEMIIGHVTKGVEMAKKAGLPKVIIDFIETHHGTTRVEYFYRRQKLDFPDQEFDETLFVYPGPKPSTKEQTILMMADSIEASSKSLKNPTASDIDNLVDKIIASKITHGQFQLSALTFKEIEQCANVFKKLLKNINHVRIEYPKEVD